MRAKEATCTAAEAEGGSASPPSSSSPSSSPPPPSTRRGRPSSHSGGRGGSSASSSARASADHAHAPLPLPEGKKEAAADATRRRLRELLDRSRYEAYVDPYRGMYADLGGGTFPPGWFGCVDDTDQGEGVAVAARKEGRVGGALPPLDVVREAAATAAREARNPWGGCRSVLPGATGSSWSRYGFPVKIVDIGGPELVQADVDAGAGSGGSTSASAPADASSVVVVPRCSCPSLGSWIDEEVSRRRMRLMRQNAAALARAAPRKKRGLKGGGGRQFQAQVQSRPLLGKDGGSDGDSGGIFADTGVVGRGTLGDKGDSVPARRGGGGGGGRQMSGIVLARRDPSPNYRCPCDFNPLCLASLGGAADDSFARRVALTAAAANSTAADIVGAYSEAATEDSWATTTTSEPVARGGSATAGADRTPQTCGDRREGFTGTEEGLATVGTVRNNPDVDAEENSAATSILGAYSKTKATVASMPVLCGGSVLKAMEGVERTAVAIRGQEGADTMQQSDLAADGTGLRNPTTNADSDADAEEKSLESLAAEVPPATPVIDLTGYTDPGGCKWPLQLPIIEGLIVGDGDGESNSDNCDDDDSGGNTPIKVRWNITVDAKQVREYTEKFIIACLNPPGDRDGDVDGRSGSTFRAILDEGSAKDKEGGPPSLTVERCMDLLRLWHSSLIFADPTQQTLPSQRAVPLLPMTYNEGDGGFAGAISTQLTLSAPPGMRNLGATCYLNSQFQCLAHNPAFTRGVFSWKADPAMTSAVSASAVRMTEILSTMQLVLARMVCGPSSVVCTDDFAAALGLENNEMQDPNEFTRLLFDRMHESFQCLSSFSSSSSSSSTAMSINVSGADELGRVIGEESGGINVSGADRHGNAHDLPRLLPDIFRGVCTYETTCQHCDSSSRRSENFMDLTLPLIKPEPKATEKKKTTAKMTSCDVSAIVLDPRDVTVQSCLDAYLRSEILAGDNQYHCSHCDAKRDARRATRFARLPPVLNVQLARYVFDRKTFMKKKLTDRVLLPIILRVPRGCCDSGGASIASTMAETTTGFTMSSPAAPPFSSEGYDSGSRKRRSRGGERTQSSGVANAAIGRTDTRTMEYVLCAVQNHRGTSAYGGHYVAEAMDWTTGIWYEYNDEEVTLLPDGPSCSYNPDDVFSGGESEDKTFGSVEGGSLSSGTHKRRRKGSEWAAATTIGGCMAEGAIGSGQGGGAGDSSGRVKPRSLLRGSADAYNMFFVERGFLAKNAAAQILHNSGLSSVGTVCGVVGGSGGSSVVSRVTKERVECYRMMSE